MARVLVLALVASLGLWIPPAPGQHLEPVAGDDVVQRFLAGGDEPLTSYRAIRHFEAHNRRFDASAALTALTELSPDGTFVYHVLDEQGSDYILSRVLRPMLEREAEMLNSGDPERYAFSPANYEIVDWGPASSEGDEGLVKVRVEPRRRDPGLINGTLLIRGDTADLVRVEGRLARNPSFWTTGVHFVRQYARVAGTTVPLRVDSLTQVRVAGASTLSIVYEYEMVNGQPIAVEPVARPAAPPSPFAVTLGVP